MNDHPIIHVSVENGTEAEMREIYDMIQQAIDSYGRDDIVVVTDEQTDLQKMPAIESYIDELADKVAERVDDSS